MGNFRKYFDKKLNEENEALKAQNMCQGAIFRVKDILDELLKDLFEANLISEIYKGKIQSLNSGYQLKYDGKFNYKFADNVYDTTNVEDFKNLCTIVGNGSSNLYCSIQPDTFFEEYFNEGTSKIKIQLPPIQRGETLYKDYKVKDKSDIKKAGDEFVNNVSTILQ